MTMKYQSQIILNLPVHVSSLKLRVSDCFMSRKYIIRDQFKLAIFIQYVKVLHIPRHSLNIHVLLPRWTRGKLLDMTFVHFHALCIRVVLSLM